MSRLLILIVVGCLIADQVWADWEGRKVTVVRDFTDLANKARADKVPILLMVSQDHCPFCHKLKREILNPMLISGDYDERVVISELLIDVGDEVINFEGKSVDPGSIASRYNIWVTPTLLFLDHQGKEVHKRMLGVNTIELYGYYLDESLKDSLAAVKQGEPYRYITNSQDQLGSDPHWDL
ncbi:MAG: thioredoxin fold domain-containing protein [Candidatus Thiodiazotropha endolucinida]